MILIALGVIVALVSLFADAIGVGTQPGIIGWKQLLGASLGLAMLITGVVLLARDRAAAKNG
jgi:hypothetical protein